MIETILTSLLIASLCATGAMFFKWQEARIEAERLKKENDAMVAKELEAQKAYPEFVAYVRARNEKSKQQKPPTMRISPGWEQRH